MYADPTGHGTGVGADVAVAVAVAVAVGVAVGIAVAVGVGVGITVTLAGKSCWSAVTEALMVTEFPSRTVSTGIKNVKLEPTETRERTPACGVA